MVVANSNNCSTCSTHECVNRQRTFFSPRPYLCASLTTNSSNNRGLTVVSLYILSTFYFFALKLVIIQKYLISTGTYQYFCIIIGFKGNK